MNALAAIQRRPMALPSIDAVANAAHTAQAEAYPVFSGGRVDEIALWQDGEWIGSVFRHPDGGLGAWSSVGDRLLRASSHGDAVRKALFGDGKLRLSERMDGAGRRLGAGRWVGSGAGGKRSVARCAGRESRRIASEAAE